MKTPRLNQAQRKEQTRTALIDAALQVFIARGFQGASIDQIAEQAGYTKGAVYAHFKNKDDLFISVFRARAAVQMNILQEQAGGTDGVRQALDTQTLKSRFHGSYRADHWIVLVLEFLLYTQRNPASRRKLREVLKEFRGLVAELYLQRSDGKLDKTEAARLAYGQQIADIGFSVLYLLEPDLPMELYQWLLGRLKST